MIEGMHMKRLKKHSKCVSLVLVASISICGAFLFLLQSPGENEFVWRDIVAMQSASSYAEAKTFMESLVAHGDEAIPALIECLHETHGNELYVQEALKAIGVPALEPLISSVERGDLSRYPFIWNNWNRLPVFLRNKFRNPGNELQLQKIVVALTTEIGPDNVMVCEFLLRLSRHPYAFSRVQAIRGMGMLDERFSPRIAKRLSDTVKDPSKNVRRVAALNFSDSCVRPEDFAPTLLKLMDDPQPYVRRSAAASLGAIDGDFDGLERSLYRGLEDSQDQCRIQCAVSLLRRGEKDTRIVDTVSQCLENRGASELVLRAVEQLGLGFPELVPFVEPWLDSVSVERRIYAARALWSLTGQAEEVLPVLLDSLKAPDLGGEHVLVLSSLAQMGPAGAGAVRDLVSVLRELPDGSSVLYTLKALASIGPAAIASEPAVESFLEHSVPIYQLQAHRTLRAIRGEGD